MENNLDKKHPVSNTNEQFQGYPASSPKDDIYCKENEIPLIEKDDQFLTDGLDVPGSELDDSDEILGEEDEENNYYSLGGDNHNDLEENPDE